MPRQPAAGKLEYAIILETGNERVRVPAGDQDVVARFKDAVPLGLLLPHVFCMFFAMLFGMRAGLSAVFEPERMPRHALISLALMTVGGMVLGPFAQKYAFGAFWTGFPFGYDLTDNKTLLMWGVWVLACGVILARVGGGRLRRTAVLVATVVMTGVYLIPHSTRGSELDYELLDQGVPAHEAITEG
jgi:xanthine/uracil permease